MRMLRKKAKKIAKNLREMNLHYKENIFTLKVS